MNKWLFRAVGTVGVASGIWLLGGAAAHAQEAGAPASDPQALRGLLNDLFSPTSGLSDLGLSVDVPGTTVDAGLAGSGPLRLSANDGRTGVAAHVAGKDIVFGGKLPDLARAVPAVGVLPGLGTAAAAPTNPAGTLDRTEFLPALDGLTGGLTGGGGLGGLVGGLSSGGGPLNLVGGLTGGNGGNGGLLGGLTGGDGPLGGLTGGLTGGDGPLGGLTGGLTGGDGGGLLGGLTGGGDSGLLGGLTGAAQSAPAAAAPAAPAPPAQQPFGPAQIDPSQFSTGLNNGSPSVQTRSGTPADLDPASAAQISQATQDMVPAMIAAAMADKMASVGGPQDPFAGFDPAGFDSAGDEFDLTDEDLAALAQMDPSLFFADNPNVDVSWAQTEGLPLVNDLPLVGSILGDQGLGRLIVVGDIAQKVPLVGPVLDGKGLPSIDTLPVVGQVLNRGLISNGQSGGLPVVGSLPVVGDVLGGLGADGGANLLGGLTGGNGALGNLTGSLGNLGSLTGGLGGLTGGKSPLGGLGGLTGGGLTGGLTSGLTGGLTGGPAQEPMRAMPAPGMVTPFATGRPAAVTRMASPHATARHAETERPIAGEDTEYPSAPESAESGLPLLGQLPALSLTRTLSQLPLVGELPVVGSLPVGVALLRGLPLVGTVATLLPLD